jgi:hypothetical protein
MERKRSGPKQGLGGHLDQLAALSEIALNFPEETPTGFPTGGGLSRSHVTLFLLNKICSTIVRQGRTRWITNRPVPKDGLGTCPATRPVFATATLPCICDPLVALALCEN